MRLLGLADGVSYCILRWETVFYFLFFSEMKPDFTVDCQTSKNGRVPSAASLADASM